MHVVAVAVFVLAVGPNVAANVTAFVAALLGLATHTMALQPEVEARLSGLYILPSRYLALDGP